MGWNSANQIIDPQIPIMVKSVENDELDETRAVELLGSLIARLQEGDWDTESETLEKWTHVPWVVRAFKNNDVTLVGDGELPSRNQIKHAVRSAIDAMVSPGMHDLSDDFVRETFAEAITGSVLVYIDLED